MRESLREPDRPRADGVWDAGIPDGRDEEGVRCMERGGIVDR